MSEDGIKVSLDRPRHLRFTLESLMACAKKADVNWRALDVFVTENPMAALPILTWGALVHEDPQLTLEAVGGIVKRLNPVQQYKLGLKLKRATDRFAERMNALADDCESGAGGKE